MAQEFATLALIEHFEETDRRDMYTLHKRMLRDMTNPFLIPEDRFIEIYRVDRELTRFLIDTLKPLVQCGTSRRAIPLEIKVLTALNFYGQRSYQKAVGQDLNLGLSQPSVSRCISQLSETITNHFAEEWIVFPRSRQEISLAQQKFYQKFRFPGVIGCIDGTQISIKGPSDEEIRVAYYCRKGYYSINCQVICGADGDVISINARHPGSVHDAAIWETSDIRAHLRSANMPGAWILGDQGYPLEPWLMTLHEQPHSPSKVRYNNCHKRARNCVETLCIGRMKARSRCLLKQRELVYKHSAATNIIYACAILHNMCLSRNVPMPTSIERDDDPPEDDEPVSRETELGHHLSAGRAVRDRITQRNF